MLFGFIWYFTILYDYDFMIMNCSVAGPFLAFFYAKGAAFTKAPNVSPEARPRKERLMVSRRMSSKPFAISGDIPPGKLT